MRASIALVENHSGPSRQPLTSGGSKRIWPMFASGVSALSTENPVHPRELLATIYHSVGINPATIVYNHLNQPRELVQGEVIHGILS